MSYEPAWQNLECFYLPARCIGSLFAEHLEINILQVRFLEVVNQFLRARRAVDLRRLLTAVGPGSQHECRQALGVGLSLTIFWAAAELFAIAAIANTIVKLM